MGEDVTDMATTTSQLQAKLLALTGGQVNIMLDETTFKNSTQILREMSDAWSDMNDIQRASALELMGGKRQANVLSALIQNFDTVEKVIEASQKSTGSALKENEHYLDSIQGRIDQFNNALQSMWSNVLDDDLIKFIVQAGTELVKFIDKLGVVKTLVIGIGTYLIQKHFKGDLFGGLFNAQSVDDARERLKNLKNEIATLQGQDPSKRRDKQINRKQHQADALGTSITEYDELSKKLKQLRVESDGSKKALDDYNKKLATKAAKGKQITDKEIARQNTLNAKYNESQVAVEDTERALLRAEIQAKKTGASGLNAGQKIAVGFKAAWKSIKQTLQSMAYMMAITAVFDAIGNIGDALAPIFQNMDLSAEALQEKLDALRNELSSVEGELNNLQSELEDTDKRIEELMDQGSLTFVEQEELNKLKSVSAELKAQIGLQETLQKSLQQSTNNASVDATNAYLNTSFMSEKSKSERQEKGKETGEGVGQIVGTALGALGFLTGNPLVGAALMAVGSTLGEKIGGWIGEGVVGAVYDSEQSVGEAMDSMLETRTSLKEDQNKALAENDAQAYNEATEALRTYDTQMAKHISQIQQNYNAMDWATASPEDRKEMMEYADWLDKYNISMGTDGAKSNAIARIFGDEAQGGFFTAKTQIDELKKKLKEAQDSGEGVDDALSNLEDFKINLSDEEVERLRELGIYLYEVEDYFKAVVKEESEFVDTDLEDVAKDINKITDGLESLKSAFDEVIEKGVLTSKTIMSLKEELKIGTDYANVEEVTDAWREYLDVMMSGAATTEEMTVATEKLAQSIIEAALEENNLNPDTKFEYIAQLKTLGIENAEEYVNDLLQKNMVKELESQTSTFNKNDVFEKWKEAEGLTAEADKTRAHKLWSQLSEDEIEALAKQYGVAYNQFAELSDEAKQDIIEKYDLEDGKLDEVLEKLKEKAKLEQDIAKKQKEQSDYNDWRNGDGTNKGLLALKQDMESIEKELDGFNPSEWLYDATESDGIVTNSWYYTNDGQRLTEKQFNDLKAKYDAYAALKAQYDALWEEGESKGYIVDGKVVDPNFQADIDNLNGQINDITTAIDQELTIDVELQLNLQNKSELVDDIQNVFDTLVNAQKEYDETGYISVDTLQTLLQLEPKYLDLLVDEEGNLNLTKDALYNVARARIIDMGIQSQKNILEKATALASQGSSDALRDQIEVMQNANETGEDFVEVEMAKIRAILAEKVAAGELSQAEADAFVAGTMNQIEAVQVATQSALDNLHNSLSSSGNTATGEIEDAFQNAMDYWENRIGANQSLYEQIQNDIDLLEKQGKIAGESYYDAQISVENERLQHLKNQREEAREYLNDFEEGSEKWWEIANKLNEIEGEIDDVTMSIQELSDAMDQVHWTVFDEAHDRFGDLTTQLSNVRELLSADEDSFFNDDGTWTETGVAVLATHIQEIELYKNALADVDKELANLDIGDFDSEQEYYDKLTELTQQQHDYTIAIGDSEQSVVDMYEKSIDAVEEYAQTLVDGYNDYIDSVKEALDAERDLYDFKKNVQKQSKDIAELERRIASLSGSTNKADIAERRKLEAQLYESRESLNDAYYDHAKDSQNEALDAEASAYEKAMTKMVEDMRTSLQEATLEMDNFLNSVTIAVSMNADSVLTKYQDTELYLSPSLTNPWEKAKTAVGEYGDKATNLMDVWKADGYFAKFSSEAGTNLSSPWNAGKTAAQEFGTSVGNTMTSVYDNIRVNIQNSITELDKLKRKYAEINDSEIRVNTGGGSGGGGGGGYTAPTPDPNVSVLQEILKNVYYKNVAVDGIWGTQTSEALKAVQKMFGVPQTGKFDDKTWRGMKLNIRNRQIQSSKNGYSSDAEWYKKYLDKIPAAFHAKGTTGTKRNEWAITDEPQFGDELVLVPGKNGNLSFMRKGTGVVPADLTANLMEWGQFTPDSMSLGGGVNVSMINNAVNKPEFNFTFDALVKAEHIDENTLPEVKRFVQQEINSLVKQMNYAIKGKGAR